MRRRSVLLLVAGMTAWTGSARAQESVFNLPAPGLPASGESVRARGMGGAVAAGPGEVFSMENPAWLGAFSRAGFYLSLLGQRTDAESDDATGEFDDVLFPMGQAVVPGWGAVIGVGYHQFLDFDAGIESSVVFENDTLPVSLVSDGGIGVLAPAVAYALDERTRIGASLDVYLGSREVVRSVGVPGQTGGIARDSLGRNFDGLGFTVGAVREIAPGAWVGAAYHLRPELTSEVTRAADPDLVGRESKVDLPGELVLEVGAGASGRLQGSAVFRYASWDGADFDELGGTAADLGDVVEVGTGVEYAPESPFAWLFGPEAPVRFGYRWRRLPLRIDGESVGEWTLAFGYSRAFSAFSRIDVALEYGQRGDVGDHGLSEEYVRLGVGLGVFELWRRYD